MILSKRSLNNLMGINSNENENGEILICKDIITSDSIIIDVGARDSELPYINSKATYHLFEPIVYNFERLEKKFNGFTNVILNKLCLSDSIETVEIYKESESINKRLNFNYIWESVNPSRVQDGIKEKIDCIKLKDYLESNNIKKVDLLKIDVEGYEYNVIKGLEDKIEIIDNVIFEYSIGTFSSSGIVLSQLLELLKDFDFYLVQDDGLIYLDFSQEGMYNTVSNMYYCNILAKNKKNG